MLQTSQVLDGVGLDVEQLEAGEPFQVLDLGIAAEVQVELVV